jgi:hypothetical protein
VISDICWICNIVPHLPHKLPLAHSNSINIRWWGNASTSFGVGVVVGSHWGMWTWTADVRARIGPGRNFDIGWAEAVAVELGLLMSVAGGMLSTRPSNVAQILVQSNNSGVMAIVNKGRSCSQNTNNVLRWTYAIFAGLGIMLNAIQIAGKSNWVDALLQGNILGFLRKFPAATTCTSIALPLVLSNKLVAYK